MFTFGKRRVWPGLTISYSVRVLESITVPLFAECVQAISMSLIEYSLLLLIRNVATITFSNPPLLHVKSSVVSAIAASFGDGGAGVNDEAAGAEEGTESLEHMPTIARTPRITRHPAHPLACWAGDVVGFFLPQCGQVFASVEISRLHSMHGFSANVFLEKD